MDYPTLPVSGCATTYNNIAKHYPGSICTLHLCTGLCCCSFGSSSPVKSSCKNYVTLQTLSFILLFFVAVRELASHANDVGNLTSCELYFPLVQCDQRKDRLSNVTLRIRQQKSNWDSQFLFFLSFFLEIGYMSLHCRRMRPCRHIPTPPQHAIQIKLGFYLQSDSRIIAWQLNWMDSISWQQTIVSVFNQCFISVCPGVKRLPLRVKRLQLKILWLPTEEDQGGETTMTSKQLVALCRRDCVSLLNVVHTHIHECCILIASATFICYCLFSFIANYSLVLWFFLWTFAFANM